MADETIEVRGRARGGVVRDKNLSSERKKEIATQAAKARWEKKDRSLLPDLPGGTFAKWRGEIDLGGDKLDCYVLNDERRVIALGATVKAIANAESGDLAKFIGVSALNDFINKDLILAELIDFSIPGTQFKGKGLTTEHFELICRGYVQALYKGAPLTDRQREIAIKCAVITSGLTRTGLDALIDEATGYQYERAEDALQIKLRAFIAEELRAWEKTFPDELP